MGLFFFSCKDPIEHPTKNNTINITGVLVLNEGSMGSNDSEISLIDIGREETILVDIFSELNGRQLGDTGNDIKKYGNKIYVAVDISSTVEILDAKSLKSLAQISLTYINDKGEIVKREPRKIAFYKNKAYVCCFDGSVCRIDTNSLSVEEITYAGKNPDGICVARNKIYVSNSGGLDYKISFDSTVSVLSIEPFREIKKIYVGLNPYTLQTNENDDVYVSLRGNYNEGLYGSPIGYSFVKIDTRSDIVAKRFDDLGVLHFTIEKNLAYLYSYDYTAGNYWIKVFDTKTDKVVNEKFISDNTKIVTPYGIGVNPQNGDVYIADAKRFMESGEVFCFDKTGKLKFKTKVGMNPQSFVFLDK